MKIPYQLAAILLFIVGTMSARSKQTIYADTYKVDVSKSSLNWKARKVTGEHTGTLKFNEGVLTFDGGKLTGGQFTFDMNSIVCSDLTDPTYNAKLINHLKSDDFFSTGKHPTSSFTITKVTPKGATTYQVMGNMRIKGITNFVTFPIRVKQNGATVEAEGKVTLDRTKYDIKYGSTSFFDALGDKAIYDDFDIELKLLANQ
ncbi:YceI family protein [Spirosoma litoris]